MFRTPLSDESHGISVAFSLKKHLSKSFQGSSKGCGEVRRCPRGQHLAAEIRGGPTREQADGPWRRNGRAASRARTWSQHLRPWAVGGLDLALEVDGKSDGKLAGDMSLEGGFRIGL